MILGTPKALAEVPLLSDPELNEVYAGTLQVLTSGTPAQVPAAIPVGLLVRLAATLEQFHKLAKTVATIEDGITEADGPAVLNQRWEEARDQAKKLVSAPLPSGPVNFNGAPPSRLVTP